ncbi:MAG: hypothetical protein PHV25_00480 [Candidatus Pacebacteria bacterium]|nr:hypothetical protein [Candidatus Paceibacterota bacterium]
MDYENKRTVILCSIMVVILVVFSIYRVSKVDFNYDYSLMPDIPQIKTPDIEEMMSGIDAQAIEKIISGEVNIEGLTSDELTSLVKKEKAGDYKEAVLNGQISIEYPSSWIRSESSVSVNHPDMDILLFAFSIDLEFPTTIVGAKLDLDNIEEAEDFMREISGEQGISMSVKSKDYIEDDILQFEAQYDYADGKVAISKERAIKIDGNYYLISVIALNTRVKGLENQINYIFESIKTI